MQTSTAMIMLLLVTSACRHRAIHAAFSICACGRASCFLATANLCSPTLTGQREATRASQHVAHDDDGGLFSGSETGSASGASGGGVSSSAVPSRHDARSAGSSEGAAEQDPSYGEVPGSGGSCGSPQELSLEDIQVRGCPNTFIGQFVETCNLWVLGSCRRCNGLSGR